MIISAITTVTTNSVKSVISGRSVKYAIADHSENSDMYVAQSCGTANWHSKFLERESFQVFNFLL